MSSRRLPTGTVSPPSREGRVRPRSGESSSAPAAGGELARENRRLTRENRRLREQLEAERNQRQAVIDRYEGLVDDDDAPSDGSESASTASPSEPSRRATADASSPLPSALTRLARFLGLR